MVKLIHKLHNCEIYVWGNKMESMKEFKKEGGTELQYRAYLWNKIEKAIKKVGAEMILIEIVSMIDTDKLEAPVSYINDVYLKDDD